jgi:hypothetical protein
MAFVDIADLPGGIPLQNRLRVPLLDIAAWRVLHKNTAHLHSGYRKKKRKRKW